MFRIALLAACLMVLGMFGAWGSFALYFRAGGGEAVRLCLAFGFSLAIIAGIYGLLHRRLRVLMPALLLCPIVFIWWEGIIPSNHRHWATDVSRTPIVQVVGSEAIVTNVRNFAWVSGSQADAQWEKRSYDLDTLISVDLLASYWAGKTIAHTFVSFGFSDGRYLAWSAELRRSQGQAYTTLESLFKLSELVLVAGDERDIVGVRARMREEDVRLYRLSIPREAMRTLFASYAREADDLAERPRWYNTLTNNCTTTIFELARAFAPTVRYDWRILLPGHFPEYAYSNGAFGFAESFRQIDARSHISDLAKTANMASSIDFSQNIRTRLR